MDDTNTITDPTYTVAIGGTEYQFSKPDPDLIERMVIVFHMNADAFVTLEACTKWLSVAAGPVTWAAIMRRFMAGEITADDVIQSMLDLVTAWTAPKDSTVDAA